MNRILHSTRTVVSIYPFRLAFFGVLAFGLFTCIYFAAERISPETLSRENGPLEMLQVALVGIASVMLFVAAFSSERGRACLTVMAAMAGYAAAREMDSIFESLLFDDAYKYVAGIPLFAIALRAVWRDRGRLFNDGVWLSKQPVVTLFSVGGIYLFCVCQVLDSPAFWGGSGTHEATHASKQMVEEFCEVFAYLLIAYAGAESIAMTILNRSSLTSVDEEPDQRSTVSISQWRRDSRRKNSRNGSGRRQAA